MHHKTAYTAGAVRALTQMGVPKTAGFLDLFKGKPEKKNPEISPEHMALIHDLADKYQLDRGYALQTHGPFHAMYPGATEHNLAAESDMQRLSGGPGVEWDSAKWGHPNPLRTQFDSRSGALPPWASGVTKLSGLADELLHGAGRLRGEVVRGVRALPDWARANPRIAAGLVGGAAGAGLGAVTAPEGEGLSRALNLGLSGAGLGAMGMSYHLADQYR